MASPRSHPKPIARCTFYFTNILLLGLGIVFLIIYVAAKGTQLGRSTFLYVILGLGLAATILSVFGCIGAQYGPKGKEIYLFCLVAYYFILFIVIVLAFVVIVFTMFQVDTIQDFFDDYGDTLEENLDLWKQELGGVAYAVDVLIQNRSILSLVAAVFVITVAVCLLFAAYLMGYEHFLKTNLTFASSLIVTIGAVLAVLGSIYHSDINLGGDYKFVPYSVIGTGSLAGILGIAGIVCGIIPDKCLLPIFLLIIFLIILTVAFFVIGLTVMYFPEIYTESLKTVIRDACEVAKDTNVFYSSCASRINLFLADTNNNCSQYGADVNAQNYAMLVPKDQGPCSKEEVLEFVGYQVLQANQNYMSVLGFAAVLASFIFLYNVVIGVLALQTRWGVQGVRELPVDALKQHTE